MKLSNAARARYSLLALSLLAAACTETTAPQGVSSGSDDNGANCGGTEINKQNCINNQNRMNMP